jgi:hypothetical protein
MNQNKNSHMRSSLRLMLAVSLLAVLSAGLLSRNVPTGHGYAADGTCRITGLDTHSTFHYEFTRVLAAAAGFNATDAETIAVSNEATDTGSFKGYATNGIATTVAFSNTERLVGENATLWYHMPRRSQGYPRVTQPNGQAFPGALDNTCLYFLKPFPQPVKAPCADRRQGELDQLRAWAINGEALPADKAPTVTSDSPKDMPRDSSGDVLGRNVYALGIYLHAVGDSYSHEKCMMTRHIRAHVPRPFECKGVWHVTSEFGEYLGPQEDAKGAGVPFTLTAAKALWQETLKYRQANGLGPPAWDENRYMQFAKDFIATKTAALRVRKAVAEFNHITGGTAMPQPCSNSRSRKYFVN